MKMNRRQQELALHIYDNPGCELLYDMQSYFHKKKGWHPNTVKKYYNILKESEHIKEIENRLYFNDEFIELYPKIMGKRLNEEIGKKEEGEQLKKNLEQKKELYSLFYEDDIISAKIHHNTEINIEPEDFFILPGEFRDIFYELIYSLLIECFFNNPYNWHKLNKPKDLNFTITINTNWSNDESIFEKLKKNRDRCMNDGKLYPFGRSFFHKWLKEESRNLILKGKTVKELYDIGWANEQRENNDLEGKKKFVKLIGDNINLVENIHKYLDSLKEKFSKTTKIPYFGSISIEEFEKSFDYKTKKLNLLELKNNYENGIIITKSKYDYIEWIPYIKKPRFAIKKGRSSFIMNDQALITNITRESKFSAWSNLLEYIKKRFNMKELPNFSYY